MVAKAALTVAHRWIFKPAQGMLGIVNLYLRGLKSDPCDKGCAVRALAAAAVAMRHPFGRQLCGETHSAAQALSVCGGGRHMEPVITPESGG